MALWAFLRVFLQWFLFALYIGLCASLPLFLLGSWWGFIAGISLALLFLIQIRFHGTKHILARLRVRPFPRAEAPQLHAAIEEYCRRLHLPVPTVGLMEVAALNIALFGWSRRRYHMVFTRGLLNHLSREQLSALVGRELCDAWGGEIPCETWLSQFLSVFTTWITAPVQRGASAGRRIYTLKLFAKQAVLFPLTLFPAFILRGVRDEADVDLRAVKLTRKPNALAEAMRKLEAFQERIPLTVPLSDTHLFLLPPRNVDPLARVFFGTHKLDLRVKALETLRKVVA